MKRTLVDLARRFSKTLPLAVALFTTAVPAEAYEPTSHYTVKNIEGWKVHVHNDLLPGGKHAETGAAALQRLKGDMIQVRRWMPDEPLKKLLKVGVWLEVDSTNGPYGRTPTFHYHPEKDWLEKMDFHPGKHKCVEYSRAEALVNKKKRSSKTLLHELAHAYHDQILTFDDPDVLAAYKRCVEGTAYPERDWVKSDHKEFFAGVTTRYFGTEEEREALVERDPVLAKELHEIWGKPKAYVDTPLDEETAERYSIGEAVSDDPSETPLIILKDHEAKVEAAIAAEKGGELSGLKVQHQGTWIETIYLARDYSPRQGWTGKAPFLWPATGRNLPPDLEARQKAGERFSRGAYVLDGKRYEMPIHGFARDLPWRVERTVALDRRAVAKLSLRDTPETRKRYPFGFIVEADFTLEDGTLSIGYHIHAHETNSGPMPFSVGNHITFVSPLVQGTDPFEMELFTPSKTELIKTTYGLPTGESRPRGHANGVKLGGFERLSAISLTGYEGEPYILYRDPQGLAIRMSHAASEIPEQPVVLYNIWGDAPGGFFSPEPWVGLQNSLVLNKGLIRLQPGRTFEWTIRIEFERNRTEGAR